MPWQRRWEEHHERKPSWLYLVLQKTVLVLPGSATGIRLRYWRCYIFIFLRNVHFVMLLSGWRNNTFIYLFVAKWGVLNHIKRDARLSKSNFLWRLLRFLRCFRPSLMGSLNHRSNLTRIEGLNQGEAIWIPRKSQNWIANLRLCVYHAWVLRHVKYCKSRQDRLCMHPSLMIFRLLWRFLESQYSYLLSAHE